MNILLISPLAYLVNSTTKYAGIEQEVWLYSCELIKKHQVTVLGHSDSVFPEGVKLLGYKPQNDPYDAELKAYQSYQYLLRTFDVIHDFSHLHLASRFNVNLSSLNLFWHAPALAKYPKSPYNIIAQSQWAAREFKRIYHQEAKYQQSIVIDPEVYHPSGSRGNRFLTIGRMAPEKGNLNALMLCQQAGVPLDVVGGRGAEKRGDAPLDDYEGAVRNLAEAAPNRFLGEVNDAEKIELSRVL